MIYLKELEAAGSQAQPAPAAAATLAAATIPSPHLGNEIKEDKIDKGDAAASHANQKPESLQNFEQKALDQLQARNKQQKAKKADSKQERRS